MYLVSSCLIGVKCRYDGKNVPDKALQVLFEEGQAIPVCPELLGGLPCPRECCEMIEAPDGTSSIVSEKGNDFTHEFKRGAEKTLALCKALNITTAILKSKSPSCGSGKVHDGTFSGNLIDGNGLTAELLMKNNIKVLNEHNWQSE